MEFKDYQKYKWFFTYSGKLVVGGKSASQNDELLKRIKPLGNFYVMHTSHPGSPFCVILEDMRKVKPRDLEEAAIFTGSFSRAWRDGKKETSVDVFESKQLGKTAGMKTGTWGVKGKVDRKKVSLELVLARQKKVLRAVPEKSVKKKDIILRVKPGKVDKVKMASEIIKNTKRKLKKDDLIAALPAGGVSLI